jgi:hypothetical protein
MGATTPEQRRAHPHGTMSQERCFPAGPVAGIVVGLAWRPIGWKLGRSLVSSRLVGLASDDTKTDERRGTPLTTIRRKASMTRSRR